MLGTSWLHRAGDGRRLSSGVAITFWKMSMMVIEGPIVRAQARGVC